MCISVFYRPPERSVDKIRSFFDIMESHLNNIICESSFIIGDFNFDFLDVDNYALEFLNLMSSYNMFICDQNTPTRLCSNACLDHVFVNNVSIYINLHYIEWDTSDHSVIVIELPSKTSNRTQLTGNL